MLDVQPVLDVQAVAPERVRPIHGHEYDRMVELGWFDDERVELLRGVIVTMSPQGTRHVEIIKRLNRVLMRALGDRADLLIQSTVSMGEGSRPEPDVAVVPARDYSRALADTAYLIIEVADSSLRKDRGVKAEIYAERGVPENWVVNLVEDVIEVRTDPRDGAYRAGTVHRDGAISLVAFPDVSVPVREIL